MTLCTHVFFLAVAALVCVSGTSVDKRAPKTSSHTFLRASSANVEVSTRESSSSRKDVRWEPSGPKTSLDKAHTGYEEFESGQKSLTGVALWERIRRVLGQLQERLNIPDMIAEDVKAFANTFLPEPRPSLKILWGSSALVVLVVTLWFAAYLNYFYESDRDENLDRWKDMRRTPRLEKEDQSSILPDFIIVFHNPGRPRKDDDTVVTSTTLDKCIVFSNTSAEHVDQTPRSESAADKFKRTRWIVDDSREATIQRGKSLFNDVKEFISPGEKDEFGQVSLGTLRKSVLQDICTCFPGDGFHLSPFSSTDGEELFIGVSLKDLDSVRQMLIEDRTKLQIQHSVVNDMLQIGQPKDEPESSPPFIIYDAEVASKIGGPECTDLKFFRNFSGADGGETIIGAKDRISIVRRRLESFLDIDACVYFGLLKDFYPVHREHIITDLDCMWSNFTMLKDLSYVQPMNLLYHYVGPGYALQFAWNGLYCKLLLAVLPVAMLFEAVHTVENILGVKFGLTFLCFSTILVIWARIAHNLFEREERYFKVLWEVSEDSEEYKRMRPDYYGEKVKSPVDQYEVSLEYPRQKKLLRRAISWMCTLILGGFVQVGVYIWINVFEGHMDYVASGCLAFMISVVQLCYYPLVNFMTIQENHKNHHTFIRSYTLKLLVFGFFNQYSVFFYIAIKMPWTSQGCPNGDCIGLLRYQLCMVFASLCALQIGLALSKYVKVQLLLRWQSSSLREWLGWPRRVLDRSFMEEQSMYEDNRYKQQAQATVQLIIPLGFVLMFGSVAPRIVPLCLLTFSIQLRACAWLTTRCMRRPYPNLDGLNWSMVIEHMMALGMCFSGCLWVTYGALFQNAQMITKLSSFIVYVFCMRVLWTATDLLVPQESSEEKLLKARRAHVLNKLHDRLTGEEHQLTPRAASKAQFYGEGASDKDPYIRAILAGEFDKVGGFTPQPSPLASPRESAHDTAGLQPPLSRQVSSGTARDLSRK